MFLRCLLLCLACLVQLIGQEAPTPPLPPNIELAPALPSEPVPEVSYEGAFFKMLFTLVGLLGVIVLGVWAMKRISKGSLRGFTNSKTIKILERRPLSPKSMLYLVEVEGKQILISESQLEVRTLTSFREPSAPSEDR